MLVTLPEYKMHKFVDNVSQPIVWRCLFRLTADVLNVVSKAES